MEGSSASNLIKLLKIFLNIWDVITYPIYWTIYQPQKTLEIRNRVRGDYAFSEDKNKISYEVKSDGINKYFNDLAHLLSCKSLYEVLVKVVAKHPIAKCMGTRKTVEVIKKEINGKVIKKFVQEDHYRWSSYQQVLDQVDRVANGLKGQCQIKKGDKVLIFADTKAEWMISAFAVSKIGGTLATLYTTMTEEEIQYGILQTETKTIITDSNHLQKLIKVIKNTPAAEVDHIICFQGHEPILESSGSEGIKVIRFDDLKNGNSGPDIIEENDEDDITLLMYTSGTTGQPKGVMFKHKTLMWSLINAYIAGNITSEGMIRKQPETLMFLAYLPLAHIMEFTQELVNIVSGVPVAYSSPFTLTDGNTGVTPGNKGDISIAKPTILIGVPLVMERIGSAIQKKVDKAGKLFQDVFNFFVDYKKFWVDQGLDTPILNRTFFKIIQSAFGGKLSMLLSGGAPLSKELQGFLRTCVCDVVCQGYGLTESSGGFTFQDPHQYMAGGIGQFSNSCGCKVMLESWEEGDYTVQDPGGPQGELVLGGPMIADGYFKTDNPNDNANFFRDENGVKWFKTGDIARVDPKTHTLHIVDRKKQLVKLKNGEYISLTKIELSLCEHPLVEMACVVADSTKEFPMALIVPDFERLTALCGDKNVQMKAPMSNQQICTNTKVVEAVREVLTSFLSRKDLKRYEVPKAFSMVDDVWTPDTGLVTGALKLKRRKIHEKYASQIDQMKQTF